MLSYHYVTPKIFNEKLAAVMAVGGFTKDDPESARVEGIAARTVALAERQAATAKSAHLVYIYREGHVPHPAMADVADIVLVTTGSGINFVKVVGQVDLSNNLANLVPPHIAAALEQEEIQ